MENQGGKQDRDGTQYVLHPEATQQIGELSFQMRMQSKEIQRLLEVEKQANETRQQIDNLKSELSKAQEEIERLRALLNKEAVEYA